MDYHIDCKCTDFDERYKMFFSNLDALKDLDLFRKFSFNRTSKLQLLGKPPLISCDNFLAFAIKLKMFDKIYIFTKNTDSNYFSNERKRIKDKFDLDNVIVCNSDIERNLINKLKKEKLIILDIDLDMFCCRKDEYYFVNKDQTLQFCEIIKQNKNKTLLTNVALSPDYCGGWENAEEILGYFIKIFELDLDIPLRIE